MKNVTDASFENDVINSSTPVLVDFSATWCGPCKTLTPTLETISAERSDVVIAKMDIDDNADTPAAMGVRGVPTMMLFKDGKVVATKVGAAPKNAIDEWLSENI